MAEGSETKRQLGRIALQRTALRSDGGRDRPTEPAPPDQDPAALLRTLRDREDVRPIDLRRVVIALPVLAFVSRELARDRQLLPVAADEERLLVAIADPSERRTLEELEFTSGRRVFACVPNEGSLRDVIESVYAAERAGAKTYRGPLAGGGDESSFAKVGESLLPPGLADGVFDEELSAPLARVPTLGDSVARPPSTPAAPNTRRKVLVVDDSDDIRWLLVRVFREREYEVFESARGLDALQKVRECEPDVLVLDAMLPELNGFDLCRRIKASRRYGHIPIVMLSAVYRGWRVAEDLKQSYGVADFLEKPFRINDVVAAVERALHGQDDAPEDGAAALSAGPLQAGLDAYARGDATTAIELLKRGLAAEPLAFPLHYHLGLLYGKQGNVFEAIQALEGAADLKPRDFSTLKNLAVLYQRAGFRRQAAEMWERALGQAPDEETRASIRNHLMSLL